MAAPTGVNEGLPQEPAKAGRPETEFAEQGTAEAKPGATAPAEAGGKAVPAGVVPPQAAPAAEELTAVEPAAAPAPDESQPAEAAGAELVNPAGAGPEPAGAGPEPAGAGPEPAGAGPEPAGAGPEPAGAELVDPAGAELVDPAGAGPVEAGEAGEAGEADWDAEESRRDIRPLAVAGIILGVIALVGVAAGVLAVLTHGFRPKTVITYRPAAVFRLRPGECVDSGSNALKVTVLSCARPHDAEVFAVFSLPATAWAGSSAVQAQAGDGCANRFDSYIDPQLAAADLTQEYVYPNQAAWKAGERTVVCEVSGVSGQLTGSVRAKG
jgi:hypothetical protein